MTDYIKYAVRSLGAIAEAALGVYWIYSVQAIQSLEKIRDIGESKLIELIGKNPLKKLDKPNRD